MVHVHKHVHTHSPHSPTSWPLPLVMACLPCHDPVAAAQVCLESEHTHTLYMNCLQICINTQVQQPSNKHTMCMHITRHTRCDLLAMFTIVSTYHKRHQTTLSYHHSAPDGLAMFAAYLHPNTHNELLTNMYNIHVQQPSNKHTICMHITNDTPHCSVHVP